MGWLARLLVTLMLFESLVGPEVRDSGTNWVFLPLINTPASSTDVPVINAPYFNGADVLSSKGGETAIFWFGKVTLDDSYADVRVGYNDTELDFRAQIFDRRLWYDPNTSMADFTKWDSIAITLQTNTSALSKPNAASYKILTSLYWWEAPGPFHKSYRGNGTGWDETPLAVTTAAGWRGDAPNNNQEDRGWSSDFRIPFSALGLAGRPATGTVWKLGVTLYNRNGSTESPRPPQYWPEGSSDNSPNQWGRLRFGLPVYQPPSLKNIQSTMVRQGLNGAVVQNGMVGGGTMCGDGLDFFSQWGNKNYYGSTYSNVQNQVDVADWPCFSKYYVTFPIGQIPSGKNIKSATLSLHEFGGSDPSAAYPSLIQVMTINKDWLPTTLTWNNAPLAQENVAQTWVNVFTGPIVWPGAEYRWDVSRAVSQAYQGNLPVRLVLYSTDYNYHSGKYFSTSEVGDWDAAGRPTLVVEWGDAAE
jgi:hypothetical protein